MVRLALSLGVSLPQREAQTLLPLVAEALELHARALCSVEQSRWRSKDRTKLSVRLADLMAGLLGRLGDLLGGVLPEALAWLSGRVRYTHL